MGEGKHQGEKSNDPGGSTESVEGKGEDLGPLN